MKAQLHKEVKVGLILSREEAEYIMGLTQNYLRTDFVEDAQERQIREQIFMGLKIVLDQA